MVRKIIREGMISKKFKASSAPVKRVLNDDEFEAFASEAVEETWSDILEVVMQDSRHGPFGMGGAPYTYSPAAVEHALGSSEFPELTPDQREYWNSPDRCDWITPIFMLIAQDVFPDYDFKCYQSFGGADVHTECVGLDPLTRDIVALGLNISDPEKTLTNCGYPNSPYVGAKEDLDKHLTLVAENGGMHWATFVTDDIDPNEDDS
jgi:hypothetical protein